VKISRIIVRVEKGVVQNVCGVPDNVTVEIRDYDDATAFGRPKVDDNGRAYSEENWFGIREVIEPHGG